MITSIIYLVFASMMLSACGNSEARSKREHKPVQTPEAVAREGQSGSAEPENVLADAGLFSVAKPDSISQLSVSLKDSAGGTKMLTKTDFLKNVWNYEKTPKDWVFLGNKPAIIDFYANWCGPCRIASPILEEVSKEFAGKIDVYKIDTQKEQELAAVFGVRSIPAFLYIPRNGKPVMTAGIARNREDTKKMFVDNINKYLLTAR